MDRTMVRLGLTAVAVAAATRAGSAAIVVRDVWSRPAVVTGVVYATLHNDGNRADALVGASSPWASHVGMHQTFRLALPGGSGPAHVSPDEMLSMRPVTSIPIPAHGTTQLAPGGYHLMLDLRRDVHAGERVPLRLHFARAGWIESDAAVRPIR